MTGLYSHTVEVSPEIPGGFFILSFYSLGFYLPAEPTRANAVRLELSHQLIFCDEQSLQVYSVLLIT